jgi:hypothetical protein
MTESEALEALDDAELVPLMQGPLLEVKRIWRQCLEEDVPVTVAATPACNTGARLMLLSRKEDAPKVLALLQRDWQGLLDREGTDLVGGALGVEAPEGEEPPCPACGTAAPLENGACTECGLQLE